MATFTIGAGELRLTGHEVDLIHSLDIAYRLADGAAPYVDFMSPLGVLAFVPLQVFLEQGYGPGMSFLLGQALVALVLSPGVFWVGASRLTGWLRMGFGVGMVVLAMALVFGGDNPAITVAMYYNRWAWVLTSLVVLLVVLPARPGWRAPLLDGLVLGAAFGLLLLIKVTYVAALAPAVLVWVLRERAVVQVLGAVVAFGAIAGAATLYYGGVGFWTAYLGDLIAVAEGPMRRYPGEDLEGIVASPAALPKAILLLAAIVLWRRMGQAGAGLMLFLLAPGLIYIQYQNWGNDPKWLFLLGVLVLALRPEDPERKAYGFSARSASGVIALLAFVLYFPAMSNLVTSGARNFSQTAEDYTPLLPGLERGDIVVELSRKYGGQMQQPYPAVTYPEGEAPEDAGDGTIEVAGEVLPDCELTGGFVGWMWLAGQQIGAVEEAVGQEVYVADIYDFLWLFGPVQRNRGVGPWYYAADGDVQARYLMVPFCAISGRARGQKLDDIAEAGWQLREVIRTDLFILLERTG